MTEAQKQQKLIDIETRIQYLLNQGLSEDHPTIVSLSKEFDRINEVIPEDPFEDQDKVLTMF